MESSTTTPPQSPSNSELIHERLSPPTEDSSSSHSPGGHKSYKSIEPPAKKQNTGNSGANSNVVGGFLSTTPPPLPFPYYGVWNIPPYNYPSQTSYFPQAPTPQVYAPPATTPYSLDLADTVQATGNTPPQMQLQRMPSLVPPLVAPDHLNPPALNPNSALSVIPTTDPTVTTTVPVAPNSSSLTPTNHEQDNPPAIPPMQDSKYIDITEYLNLPQSQAAKKLHVPTSTLSKRWKEAVRNRKWPYRAVCKLDKEIMTILYNIPQSGDSQSDDLPPDVKLKLGRLLRERQDLLKPVIIRL